LNIMDGMDAARFTSGNPHEKDKNKKLKQQEKKMPMVLRNLDQK
jgi:hypothetical protein